MIIPVKIFIEAKIPAKKSKNSFEQTPGIFFDKLLGVRKCSGVSNIQKTPGVPFRDYKAYDNNIMKRFSL